MEEVLEDVDGSIVSIRVRNFFCHENLEISFNKNVNFIVGRNGSGKSAVLTALVVGLGARASATNRGTNLSSFVKKGANSATVEIKIKNSSEKAYKHDLYGDYITVARHITASGGSTYKVKSATGETISTKHDEVHAIVVAHDIQVDNPICVLNQDEAKSFHASDAKKKYALFRKATNLEQTEGNYNQAVENCNKAKATWKRKREAFSDMEKELKKWEICYEQLQSREESEARKKSLQNEFYWSEVAGLQREVDKMQAQYDKTDARIQQLAERLASMEQSYGANSDHIEALKRELQEKTERRDALEQEAGALGARVREVQADGRATQHRIAKQQKLVRRENKKLHDLEKEINNINTGEAAAQRAEVEAQARAAEEAAEAARARYDTAQNDAAQAQQNQQRAAADAEQAATRLQRHQDKLRNLKMQLRELESRGTDSLAVYGNKMVELKEKIKEAVARKQFSETPRGPVGSYLKVKDKKWAGSLEHIIGRNMKTFCVNTPEDSRRLFEIMAQVYGTAPKPGVTCSKFLPQQHDVSRNRVRAGAFLSALDSLHVADPVVANYLIDNVGVESILLVPDHDSAVRLSDNVENVPQNCSKIVTLDGTEYHPAPNYRSYGGDGRPSRFLQVSTAERKRQVQTELAEAEREAGLAGAEREERARDAAEAARAERDAARALQALLRERHERDAALRRARDALQLMHAPQEQLLVEELEITKERLSTLNSETKKIAEKDKQFQTKIDGIEAEIKSIKDKKAKISNNIAKLNEEIGLEQLKLDQGITERQTYSQRVKEKQGKLAAFKNNLDEKKALAEEKTSAALELGPRFQDPRDHTTVAHELKQLQVKLNSMRTDGLSREQIGTRLLDVRKKYKTTKNMLDKLKGLIEELRHTSERHLNYCLRVQNFIAQGVQYCFQSILTLRGYSGSMEIDVGRGVLVMWCSGRETSRKRVAATTSSLSGGERSYSTVAFIVAHGGAAFCLHRGSMEIDVGRGVLEMWCSGREASRKRVAATTSSLSGGERSYSTVAFIVAHGGAAFCLHRGSMEIDVGRGVLEMWCSGREASGKRVAATTSSLSGGERSYSTVAFIMALWECVELPFYFMDEFDVFMDNVNRKIVMELLIDHALKNSNRQFVFLTPQDASSVTAGPNIQIHRMADPREN